MHFTLHLSQRCNMRCSYCYAPPCDSPVMPEAVGRAAIDLGARMSEGSCGIIFFGGEPLLHRDLIAALTDYAARHPSGRLFHHKITTNGTLLDGEFLDFAVRSQMLVAMSFDGVREAHDAHRRAASGAPTWDLLLPKLNMLLEARPYSSVFMVVNPDTAQYLDASASFLIEDIGVRYLIVSLNYAADWTEDDFEVLRKQYEKLGDRYVRWTRAGRKFYFSPFEVKISSHVNRDCYQKERCELAQRQVSVGPDGTLYPCVQFTHAGPDSGWRVGHVDTGVDEAARARLGRESSADKPECDGCAIQQRCNNTCGCLNWQTTGGINTVSPVLCRHEQTVLPVADRVAHTLYRERHPLFLHKHYNEAYPFLSLIEDSEKGPARG